MQIEKVEIYNFKCIEKAVFVPEKLNLFMGKNGTGKTSYLEAVRWALTGEFPVDAVRNGADSAVVIITLFGGKTIERSAGQKAYVKVDGKTTTQKSVAKFLEDNLGVTQDVAKVSTSADLIEAMNAGKLSEFLVTSGLIPADITFDEMVKRCPMTDEAQNEISMMLPSGDTKFGLPEIEEAYTTFYEMRTITKRDYQNALARAHVSVKKPTKSKQRLDDRIAELMALKETTRLYNSQLAAYERAMTAQNKALQDLKALGEGISASKPVTVPDKTKVTQLEKQLYDVEKQIQNLNKAANTVEANLKVFASTLAHLNTSVCPISKKLICSTDKTVVKDELEKAVMLNKQELERLAAELITFEQRETQLKAEKETLRQQEIEYVNAKSLQDRYDFMKAHIPELPVLPEKPSDSDKDIETLLQAAIDERNQYSAYENTVQAANEVKRLEERVEILEEVVAILNPKNGIREKIIEFALEPIIQYCNEQAKKLNKDFSVSLYTNKGVHIMCSPANGTGMRDIAAISSGQRLFALFLIMDMLNKLSGYGILMLDNLDKLDAEAFESLMELLQQPEVKDSYDHIFAACVNHEDSEKTIRADKDYNIICM